MKSLSFDIDAVIAGKARLTEAQARELHCGASLHARKRYQSGNIRMSGTVRDAPRLTVEIVAAPRFSRRRTSPAARRRTKAPQASSQPGTPAMALAPSRAETRGGNEFRFEMGARS
jgi:hypothetical protein